MAEKVPLPHWVHWVMLDPPVPARKVPATHAVHTEELEDVEKVPATHAVHTEEPADVEKVPAAQLMQALDVSIPVPVL